SESPWLLEGMAADRPPESRLDGEAPSELTLFSDLAAVTRSYFNDISIMLPPPDDIASVLGAMRTTRDTVINFNWDEEVDLELTQEGEGPGVTYTYGAWLKAGPKDGGILNLKPHGSVGWYDIRHGIGNANAYFIAENDDQRVPRYQRRILAYDENEQPLDIDA